MIIFDPGVYKYAYDVFTRLEKPDGNIDLYRDIGVILAEQNRRRLERGQESFLNAIPLLNPVIDYGTPPRLAVLHNLLKGQR